MRLRQKIFIAIISLFYSGLFGLFSNDKLTVPDNIPVQNRQITDCSGLFNFSCKYMPRLGISSSEKLAYDMFIKTSAIAEDEKMLNTRSDFFTDRGSLFLAIGAVSAGIGTGIGSIALILYFVQKTVVDETSEIMYLALGITGSVILTGSIPFFVIGALTLYKSKKAKVSFCYAFVF